MSVQTHHNSRYRRHHRVRMRVTGSAGRPRLVVFRSLKHIYAQLVDDTIGQTLAAASDRDVQEVASKVGDIANKKMIRAHQVGALLAQKALEKNIKTAVFDRGGYRYHGRVKALAEGARSANLVF